MTGPDDEHFIEVTNPRHTALKSLRTSIQNDRATLSHALRSATRMMQEGGAWSGPTTARTFTQEVSGRNTRLPGLVDQLLDEVNAELASTPETIRRPRNRGMMYE